MLFFFVCVGGGILRGGPYYGFRIPPKPYSTLNPKPILFIEAPTLGLRVLGSRASPPPPRPRFSSL